MRSVRKTIAALLLLAAQQTQNWLHTDARKKIFRINEKVVVLLQIVLAA
jgi:hypothetical protein